MADSLNPAILDVMIRLSKKKGEVKSLTKIYRNSKDMVAFGVLSGISCHYHYNISLVRVVYAIFALFNLSLALTMYFIGYLITSQQSPNQADFKVSEMNCENKTTAPVSNNIVIGGVIILLGASLFFKGIFSWLNPGIIIAGLLIVAGVVMLKRQGKGYHHE